MLKCHKIGFRILIPFLILLFSIITCLNTLSIIDNNLTNTNRNLEEIKYKETLKVSSDKELYRIWGLNSIDSRYVGRSVAHDSDGNYYMVGDSYSASSDDVAFLVKYDNNGNLQWNKIWSGEGGYPECEDVAVDSSDNIYVTGTIKKGGVYVINTLKFSKTGVLEWNSTVGGGIEVMGMGIAIGHDNYLYVTGFNYTASDTSIVLVKYHMTTGNIEDLRSYEGYGSSNSRGYGIAIDLSNNIYICGKNSSGPPTNEIILLKLNSTMDLNWSRSWINPYLGLHINQGYSVAVDSNGEIYIVGLYEAYDHAPASYHDGIFLKYNDTGGLIFEKILHNQYNNTGLSDIYINQDDVYICGFEGKDYDDEDSIVLRYNTTGDLKEKKYWGGNDDDSSWGITVRNPSEIVIVGRTESYTDGSIQDAFILKYYNYTAGVSPSGDDDDDDDDSKDGIIPGYDISLIIILITFISSISLYKKMKNK